MPPLDASANGYVRGEGCGILVLKRLSEAEADGDRIWAVIRGTSLNQDGASVGVKPYVIGGHSMGEIAGAQAAGVFTVEDGLCLAASFENSEAVPAAIDMAPPSLTLIDSSTGRPVGPGERLDELYWRQTDEPSVSRDCVPALARLGVQALVEVRRPGELGLDCTTVA
ncbi:MAG: beta-ketoacyl synthase N-terminal-like domain-containing protein [Actinomycetia bacterium]|nr:beta-ketoacyl synthase N-terminal-like domain-containing protein [Actinomycetes bacterium]